MAAITAEKLSQLPDEMLRFTLQKASEALTPRLGNLSLPGRKTIDTPSFLGNTSRGVVPHLTQDNLKKHTSLKGVYVALEDFIERAPQQIPPIYQFKPSNGDYPLRRFISLQDDSLLVVGARRLPPVDCPAANTNSAVQIYTSVGFRQLPYADYTSGAKHLKPDIVVALGDVPQGGAPSRKRVEKMGDRTAVWVKDIVAGRLGFDRTTKDKAYNIFAPILPISNELQSWYLDPLVEEMITDISGLAIYDADSLAELPKELQGMPFLSMDCPRNPNRILYEVSLGMDLFVVPFLGTSTDAGIALDFRFPAPNPPTAQKPLGIDMWSPSHATDLSPLQEGCQCYTCKKHHRAYLQHLLAAKEMLGWVLLQIHNHQVMEEFFNGIRASISKGTFEADRQVFERAYEADLPDQTGQGPRVRGYQFKSEGPGEQKKNAAPYTTLDNVNPDMVELLEAPTPDPEANASDLEKIGFADSQR